MIALGQQLSPLKVPGSLRLAVFDCDGTLVDSAHSIVSCMKTALAVRGFAEPTPEQVRAMVGLPLEDAISRLYPDMEADMVMDVSEGYRASFSALREKNEIHEPLYHGTIGALSSLKNAGWLLGVATGKSRLGLVATLKTHAIDDRFVTLQTADLSHGKPNPDMLFKAMAEAGTDASSTVMIGDTSFDMEMARNAGTLAIGVTWGYHKIDELTIAGAHRIVETYDQLPDVIESLLAAGK